MSRALSFVLRRFGPLLALLPMLFCNSAWAASPQIPIQTVFIILMENHNWSSGSQPIKGAPDCPYINNVLLPIASRCEQYYNPPSLHPSEPNYIWLVAGNNFGILNDNNPSVNHLSSTANLFTQLDQAGISWKTYQENITGTYVPDTNKQPYVVRHNPFVFFDSVRNNLNYCTNHVRPYTELAADLQNNNIARYNFLTPNVTNDMHDLTPGSPSTRSQGDHWLSIEIPKIMASQAYNNNGAIFITWDEGASSSDGPIGMIVLSPKAKGNGYFNNTHYTHSSTLRTFQNIFGVGPYLGDAANATDLSDLFVVNTPPTITQQPAQNTYAAPGGTATFTAAATGAAPLSYSWQKDGNPITGATSPTLMLSNVQMSDQAGYRMIANNPYGSATSSVANLTVILPPSILTQPQDTNVFVGTTVTFNVSASGGPPLTYQWFFKGNPVSGATSSTLTLTNVQTANSGNYTVRVTNPLNSVLSSNANLTVIIGPTVTIVASSPSAAEAGLVPGAFTISRSGGTALPVTIYFTVGGSATPGSDYVSLVSPVTIQAGAAFTNLTVTPIDDSLAEAPETVIVTLSSGTNYALGSPSSSTVTIADNDNLPPSVTITNPVNGAFFNGPLDLALGVTATDSDGSVVKVDYYADGTNRIGTATSPPFSLTWASAPAGNHTLTAIATDNLGATGASPPVSISINGRPVVTITAPDDGASFVAPANLVVTANATDDGSITLLEVFVGNTLLGSSTSSSQSFPWTNIAIGTYVLTARATDNLGAVGVSAPVTVTTHEPTPNFGDSFANRGVVNGFTNFVYGDSSKYTREPGEPYHNTDYGTASAWISWTAPASGTCTMTTTTNGLTGVSNLFDTVLAIYTGDVVSELAYVASNDDDATAIGYTAQSRVSFSAVAGTTYQVAVDGYGAGQGGSIYFRLSLPVAPIVVEQPQPQVADPGSLATFHVIANGTTPLTYQWQFGGTNIAGATNSTFTAVNVQPTTAGNYSVLVGNSLGQTNSLPAELIVRPKIISGIILNDHTFRLTLSGTPGKTYAVESAFDPANWSLLGNISVSNLPTQYTDNAAPAYSNRLYRLRLLP